MKPIQNSIPVLQLRNAGIDQPKPKPTAGANTFASVLEQQNRLKFSNHAQKRIQQRALPLSNSDMNRLEEAVSKAETKGSKDALVLDGEHAYLVNVQERTVITAMQLMELREKVFTNIDSTIIT